MSLKECTMIATTYHGRLIKIALYVKLHYE